MKTVEMTFRPLTANGGAEVQGVDLRDEFTEEMKERIRAAWHQYGMLLFRDQKIDEDDQTRFAKIFGEINEKTMEKYAPKKNGFDYISNVMEEGHNPFGKLGFHTECSFFERPLAALMLYALEVPPEGSGGETRFCNLELAYDSLPDRLKERIANLKVRHGYPDSSKNEEFPGLKQDPDAPRSVHPLAFPHPVTGRTLLFLSRRHVDCILDVSPEESTALIDELFSYIGQPGNTFEHAWRPGDLVIWDNHLLQHGRNDFEPGLRRHLRRLQVRYPNP